ncbi:MAG: HAD-IA family hydrolase [Pseudomonadota bacterium]
MFEAVIFDCDGVLVDSEALGLEDSAHYLQSHGLDWSPADLVRLFTGLRDDVFAAKLTEAYRKVHGAAPLPEFFSGLVEQRRKKKDQLQAVSGAHEALRAIRQSIAVASSSRTEFLTSKLKRVDLWALTAPHVYSADLVPHGKPAPDIFLYAARKLGAAPETCVVVEDSVNGVKAGVAAGMTVFGFTGGGHCFDGHGERLIDAGAAKVARDFPSLVAQL